MKPSPPEMIEGREAFVRFQNAMKAVLKVPHAEIKRLLDEYRKQVALNPNRRGPKRKSDLIQDRDAGSSIVFELVELPKKPRRKVKPSASRAKSR